MDGLWDGLTVVVSGLSLTMEMISRIDGDEGGSLFSEADSIVPLNFMLFSIFRGSDFIGFVQEHSVNFHSMTTGLKIL